MDSTCHALRSQESEVVTGDREITDALIVVNCDSKIIIKTDAGQSSSLRNELQTNGDVKRVFSSQDTGQYALQFDDLSVHYFKKNQKQWIREEALSQIQQVDIFDRSLIQRQDSSELESLSYLKTM